MDTDSSQIERNTQDSASRSSPPNRKRGLGRGLGALIVDTQPAPGPDSDNESNSTAASDGVRQIRLDAIEPNPQQPRNVFDPAALEELAASIRVHGILQPLIVTRHPQAEGRYWLVAGERRWRAARQAQLEHAPAIVREASSVQLVEWALVENLQRADLNPLEEAAAYQTLIEEFTLTQTEIGDRVGKSRSAIANTIRLLQLPRPVQEALSSGQISAGHARALLALSDDDVRLQALARITAADLTVRQTEELVKQWLAAESETETHQPEPESDDPTSDNDLDSYIAQLETRFREALGTRVSLSRGSDGRGKLTVHFYSEEDLAALYQLIVGVEDSL